MVLPRDVFPYSSFRQGQEELAQSVYLACRRGNTLVAEAMSGFGKTAAVLAGSICAAENDDLQIIYACRTKRQVFRVLEELRRFALVVPIRAASLFSKYDYCLLKRRGFTVSPETFKWYCSFHTSNNLCSYFLNVPFNLARVQSLVDSQTTGPGSISDLLKIASDLHVCPYEVARLSLSQSRIVVTTYHYLLDEASRSILIPADRPLGKIIAIIDEAHNIRDFVSGNSTATLSFSDIKACLHDSQGLLLPPMCDSISQVAERAMKFCSRTSHWLLDKEAFTNAITMNHSKEWLPDLAFQLSTNSGIAWYTVATNHNLPNSIIRLGRFLSTFLASLESDDATLVKSDSALSLVDTNPAKRFLSVTTGLHNLILLSATIDPPRLFLRSIGLEESSTTVHTAVTDYKFQVKTLVDGSVTTRFKTRTPHMYSEIAQRIIAICNSVRGGVGVFAPSYLLLKSLYDSICGETQRNTMQSKRTILVETPRLTNEESERMISTFKSVTGCLLLAVQGGHFSEGEDFPGDEMDVSVVVGLPLSPPSPTTYAEYKRMDASFDRRDSYMILSLLPALRKAFQCAGRHVREPGKIGMVIFMDSRFAQPRVISLMPAWLRDNLVQGDFTPESIAAITRDFFFSQGR